MNLKRFNQILEENDFIEDDRIAINIFLEMFKPKNQAEAEIQEALCSAIRILGTIEQELKNDR